MTLWMGMLVFAGGLGVSSWYLFHQITRQVGSYEERYLEAASSDLNSLMVFMGPQELLRISRTSAGFAFLLVLLMTMRMGPLVSLLLAGGGGFLAYSIPRLVLGVLVRRRTRKFHEQLPDAITMIANATGSGAGIPEALRLVAKQLDAPMSEELQLLLQDRDTGKSIEEAFDRLSRRIPIEDLKIFTMVMKLTSRTGGNISEALQRLAETVRNRFVIEKKVESITAQARFGALAISAIPFVIFIVINLINPELMAPIRGTLFGLVVLIVVLVLQGTGGYIMWKITQIKY